MDTAFVFTQCGPHPVCLWLHTSRDPSDEVWKRAMAEHETARRRASSLGGEVKALVVSDGGAPTLRQRSLLTQVFDYRPFKVSIVTTAMTNPVKRGIATAMRWFNPALSMFPPDEMPAALAHLGLGEYWPQLETQFRQMQGELPQIRALELAVRAMD